MFNLSLKKCLISLLLLMILMGIASPELWAQGEDVLVSVGKVDSNAFPQVSVSVRICDGTGPKPGLEIGAFRIQEENNPIPAVNTRAFPIASPTTRLVLAIDTSMNATELAAVKKAAESFVKDFVGAEDDLAVVAFYDDIELIHDFTNNQQSLMVAIDSLSPEGNMTAFNDAALESVRL